MRFRMVLATVLAVVAMSPSAASAGGGGPIPPDGLQWIGHSACATAEFESITISPGYNTHYFTLTGTVTPCYPVKPGDFFAVAYFRGGVGAATVLVWYDQAPSTHFAGTIQLSEPLPVCLASWYTTLMACFSVSVSGSTWTAVPLATTDPSVSGGIDPDLWAADPNCATCWPGG